MKRLILIFALFFSVLLLSSSFSNLYALERVRWKLQVSMRGTEEPVFIFTMEEPQLVDFDWSLRLVLSSQHLSSMRKPILLVDLDLKYANGTSRHQILELAEQDLDKVLNSFASVEKVLQLLPDENLTT